MNDVLLRKARGILNKLCPQKFDVLVEKFKELEIDSEEKLRLCMELVFEKVSEVKHDGFYQSLTKILYCLSEAFRFLSMLHCTSLRSKHV